MRLRSLRTVWTAALFGLPMLLFGSAIGISPCPGQESNSQSPTAPKSFRALAPGVLQTIYPDNDPKEQVSRHDIVDLLAKDPDFGEREGVSRNLAKDVRYEHKVWGLEFTFKPVRMIEVNIPTPDGRLERKLIWYLLYNVRNPGPEPVTFVPRMFLRSHDSKTREWVPDMVIPVVVKAINEKEDPARKIHDSVTISAKPIPPAEQGVDRSVWGVATFAMVNPKTGQFESVDSETDEFSIYIQGLTNAYKMENKDGKRKYLRKTLQINFWRPGDEFFEDDSEIRYGMPDKLDYEWRYM